MNKLFSNVKKMTVHHILKTKTPFLRMPEGHEFLQWDLKIKWEKPVKIPSFHPSKSGDGGIDHNLKPNDPAYTFGECEEYKTSTDTVKDLVSLDFLPMVALRDKHCEMTVDLVKRHKYDINSLEAKIAALTSTILYFQDHVIKHPKNGMLKKHLKETIEKRRSYLMKMRRWDYRRFEFLLERLNLIFKDDPTIPLKLNRNDSLRKLTQKYHDQVVNKKLAAYREELEAQQKDFYIEKAEKLAFIRSEEIALGLEPTVNEEDITAAREKAAQLQ